MSAIAMTQIKQEIKSSSYEEQISLLAFIADLLKEKVQPKKSSEPKRKLGGLEKGFWIADDFDETPECFKEYV